MFKKQHLALAFAATLAAGAAQAALETSVTLKNETAYMMKDGIRTGEATSTTDTTGEGKGVYKFENTAKIYLNDEMDNGMSWHGELNIVRDTKAIDDYKGHENYSQQDWLRELYVDTTLGDWDVRLGKQQVVWGTADGIKLLDMINPTDWREFNQNTMADARIPVWMINAEKYLENGSNIQAIISQPKESKLAGLNASGDQGHPFVMKGVDTITGKVNGFLNIAPALATVATTFNDLATFGATNYGGQMGFDGEGDNAVAATALDGLSDDFGGGLAGFAGFTVDGFGGQQQFTNGNLVTKNVMCAGQAANCIADAEFGAGAGTGLVDGGILLDGLTEMTNNNVTNLTDTTYVINIPTAAFEYMPMSSFATFATFAGNLDNQAGNPTGDNPLQHAAVTTEYTRDYKKSPNIAFRFKNTTSNGLNYSMNYAYGSDVNPAVDLSWHDASTGERLSTVLARVGLFATGNANAPMAYMADPDSEGTADFFDNNTGAAGADGTPDLQGSTVTVDQLPDTLTADANGQANNAVAVLLRNANGQYYTASQMINTQINAGTGEISGNAAVLRFTEYAARIHQIGSSFDYAIDTGDNPIVLRGEFLYQKDTLQPVINRQALAYGDLEHALTMRKADMFKYVIGADTTVMTDMMLSGQFIQFRNLDYVDSAKTCTTNVGRTLNCGTYTADYPTLSLTNDLNKAEENKNFYSVFLSKPFGESGEGRWNNIFIYEEGGGKWNRFDVEYGFDDQLIGTFEVNKYFGDENTMFGQFENASNVQVGLKYLLQ